MACLLTVRYAGQTEPTRVVRIVAKDTVEQAVITYQNRAFRLPPYEDRYENTAEWAIGADYLPRAIDAEQEKEAYQWEVKRPATLLEHFGSDKV